MRARCLTALGLVLAAGSAAAATAGPTAWVSNERDNTVSVLDVGTMSLIDTIPVGKRPRGIVFSPDYRTLYVCASDDDTVQVLDVASRKHQAERRKALDTHPSSPCRIVDPRAESVCAQQRRR